jgi:hypothetical protein
MEPSLRRLVGVAAVIAPALYLLSDVLEWAGGGFSSAQLWVNYVGFLPMPFVMIGLYAVQRPRAGWGTLLGAVLYGAAFVYFAHTTLYALTERTADYAALLQKLGPIYTVHGGLMVIGGLLFGIASLRLDVLPRAALLAFLLGVTLNLLFSLLPVPALWQTIGSTVRNVGLIAMGVSLLGAPAGEAAA